MMIVDRFIITISALCYLKTQGFKLDITSTKDNSTATIDPVDETTSQVVNFGGGIIFENGVLKSYTTTIATTTSHVTVATEDMTTEMMKKNNPRIVSTDVDTTNGLETTHDAVNFEKDIAQLTTESATTLTTSHEHQHNHEHKEHMNMTISEVIVEHYHDHDHLEEFINILEKKFPKLVTKYTLGSSVEGREILAMKITSEAGKQVRPVGTPMVKYVANMHGDESVGREMLVALAEYLVKNYGVVNRITTLIDTTEIHLVPTINPDGFERVTRGNFNGVDLNRGFPGQDLLSFDQDELFIGREKEVVAVMKWILENPFVSSINFHDGAVVANYPYDEKALQPWVKSSLFRAHHKNDDEKLKLTPDNEEFLKLASLYSDNHKTMHSGEHNCQKFDRGITNGADWYEIRGGMQDFNYLYTNCMEITLELSCVKKPKEFMLQREWENNRDALVAYLETARGALHGIVTDKEGKPVKGARIEVIGRAKDVLTTDKGEYWRILASGKHKVRAILRDLQSDELEIEIKDDWTSDVGPVGPRVDLQIRKPLATIVTSTSTTLVTTTSTTIVTTTSTTIVTTTSTTTTTVTTTTTTEDPGPEGTNLYVLPGVCINLSFAGIRGCKQQKG